MTGQGRPALRPAAWRAVWGALKSNPVYAARFAYLTSREHNKFSTGQAQAALAAALLRQLHAVVITGRHWDPPSPPMAGQSRCQPGLTRSGMCACWSATG